MRINWLLNHYLMPMMTELVNLYRDALDRGDCVEEYRPMGLNSYMGTVFES